MSREANIPTSAVKLALAAQRLRAESGGVDLLQSEPIAIIGLGCRFPGGASTPEKFWRLLESGTDAVREIPPERWDIGSYYDPDPGVPAKMSTRWAGLLDQVDQFDADFFGIAPREAAAMDPQQRTLLEVAWETLNDAGHSPESLSGSSTGVFFALYNSDYARLQFADPATISAHTSSGTSHGVAAGRLSYLLNLHGPSMAIDTACSSSLVAVHLACQSLRAGECSLALAGGVSALITPEETISLSKWGMLAPDGRCKTFDATANGFVRGEGCGMVALKRLADALGDGDRVLALVRGSAVNQDGRSAALTAPNGIAQEAVLRQALKNARITSGQLSYVEAHGTGTALGDPIEVEALAAVLGQPRPDSSTCRLGSVKTNLGHLEAAAGVAGLIKIVLAMQHQMIPPHLHFKKLNPLISLEGTCLVIGREAVPWPASAVPRCAGVSSFGFGGTNAHVILEEAPQLPTSAEAARRSNPGSRLLPISARNGRALGELAEEYAAFLSDERAGGQESLGDLCYTASLRRWHYPARVAFVGATQEEMTARIRAYLAEKGERAEIWEKPGKLVFVFSGHGSQWDGMGQSLFEREPVYRQALTQCDATLGSLSGWSVLEELKVSGDRSRLGQTEIFQPVLFAVQVALAALWRSWGIIPEAVLGHSVGEIAAAHVAGIIGLEDATRIVVHRGRTMQAASGQGGMAAVEISLNEAAKLIAQGELEVTIAAINGPRSVTLSGATEAIDQALVELSASGIRGRRLEVNCAFHSSAMIPCADALEKEIAGLSPLNGTIPLYSTVDGRLLEGRKLDATYWRRNICEPVQFAVATAAAIRSGHSLFLELSPHPVLATSLKQCLEAEGTNGAVMSSMRRGQDESATMLTSLGSLYTFGRSIQWKALHPGRPRCISLPPYPWQRERHWAASHRADDALVRKAPENAWPGRVLRSAFFDGVMVECQISPDEPRFVNDHRVSGVAMVPATAMIYLALRAARQVLIDENLTLSDTAPSTVGEYLLLENLAIDQALVVPDQERRALQLGFKAGTPDSGSFQLFSRRVTEEKTNRPWTLHASGSVRRTSSREEFSDKQESPTLDGAVKYCGERVDVEFHYQTMWKRGIEFGPLFRGVEALWRGAQSGLARIRAIDTPDASLASGEGRPALLDACLQAISPAMPETVDADGFLGAYLPVAIEQLWLSDSIDAARWSFARLREQHGADNGILTANVWIFDDAGQTVGEVRGLRFQRAERSRLAQLIQNASAEWLYELHWEEQPLRAPAQAETAKFDKRCLVFADHHGIAQRFAQRLAERGFECLLVKVGERFRRAENGWFEVAPAVEGDFIALLQELRRRGQWPFEDVVHFWGLDLPPAAPDSAGSLSEEQVLSFGSVLHFLQALNGEQVEKPPRIWLVSRSAVAITGEASLVEPTQAPVWGLGQVVTLEHPEYRCTKVDIQGNETTIPSSVDQLCDELCAEVNEDRVTLTGGRRFVARLQPLDRPLNRIPDPTSTAQCLALHTDSSGILDKLQWRPCQRRIPEAGEVEIEVTYAGLNFRDVLMALKVVAARGERLGGECAGRVVSVGRGVTQFQKGDEVIAFAMGGMASYMTVSTDLVIHKPNALSLEQASALPIVFLTALYAFRLVTSLQPGQRVLIHAAAGGVGSAAVQLAKLAGAEIFATAGSSEKRSLLKSWGVQHIFDSRSLSFADEIRALVGERGVNVVLNSLSGEFVSRSLALVRPGGAFIELGKRDLLEPEEVERTYPGVLYTAFDLADVSEREPQVIRSLFEELKKLVESGAVQLPPTRTFMAREIATAFRYMAQGHHVGKIVIQLKEKEPRAHSPAGAFESDGAWLVTGGLGGLGLRLATWLAGQGVSRLALIGRHSPTQAAHLLIEELRNAGVSVEIYQADVGDRGQLGQVLDDVRGRLGTLRGVVHAAGLLDDGPIAQMDWPRSRAVLWPKIDGAWNLHQSTLRDPLSAFVLFSSAASILGWPGQGNYAAANAFLDALAHYRHAQGLPATSINWGAWADAGMSANLGANHRERFSARGLLPIAPEKGFAALGELLSGGATQVVAVPADWSKYTQQLPRGTNTSFLRSLIAATPTSHSKHLQPKPEEDLAAQWAALPPVQRLGRVRQLVESHASRALGVAPGKPIDSQRALHEMGLDSLMSVELRNALAGVLGRSLSATLVFDYPTIESLSRHLAKDVLKLDLGDSASPQESIAPEDGNLKELQAISESEAESLLLAELDQLKNAIR
jgi:mycoketide-CoA synthase